MLQFPVTLGHSSAHIIFFDTLADPWDTFMDIIKSYEFLTILLVSVAVTRVATSCQNKYVISESNIAIYLILFHFMYSPPSSVYLHCEILIPLLNPVTRIFDILRVYSDRFIQASLPFISNIRIAVPSNDYNLKPLFMHSWKCFRSLEIPSMYIFPPHRIREFKKCEMQVP